MSDDARSLDVVVLGAGPAGCAAAILLARRAHRVALVRPTTPPAPALAESIPPSARRVLDELGALAAVDAAVFHPNRGNLVHWAGSPPRREDFASEAEGFHTDRISLERVLVSVAEQAGVIVFRDTACRSGSREDAGAWSLHCEQDGEAIVLRARLVVDATGRKGVLARPNRIPDRSTTTLAVVRRWRRPGGWNDDESNHTVVESYDAGWSWSVPLGPDVRCLTTMIDQRTTDLEGASLDDILDAELDKTDRIGPLRAGAEPVGSAWACPASLYTSARFAEPGLVLAGDAGSFIDPLSSFGVKKALSSGWLAGIVVHTALVDPGMAPTALDFFHRREATVYQRYRAISADFFAAGAEVYGTPYWTERAAAARLAATQTDTRAKIASSAPSPPVAAPDRLEPGVPVADPDRLEPGVPVADPDRLEPEIPESDVRAAFESLKARDTLDAVTGPTVRVVERPAIEGQRIVLQDHVASDLVPRGLRFVRGVDLRALLDVVPRHDDVADGWAAYNAVAPPVTLPDYVTALSTAFAAGLLAFAATREEKKEQGS